MELNEERKNRYFSKCGYIIEKMDTIPDNVDDLDEIGLDGLLYRVQTSIDAAIDMTAMLVRDIGIDVCDDYENIDTELILQNLENVKKQLHRFVNIVEGELS